MEAIDQRDSVVFGGVQVSKVERYGWTMQNKPGEFAEVDKETLNIDQEYQRNNVSRVQVQRIATSWNWMSCLVLGVARRPDGTLWVFEGQHRLLAARKRIDIKKLPCIIFDVDDKQKEAESFGEINSGRKSIIWVDKIKALEVSGDQIAIKTLDLLRENGCKASTSRVSGRVACISTVYTGIKENETAMSTAFSTLAGAFPDNLHSDLLKGLYYIEKAFQKEGVQSVKTMAPRLKHIGFDAVLRSIQNTKALLGFAGAKVCARGILTAYNKGLKNRVNVFDD